MTYRERTKEDWLGISARVIRRETAVSELVASQMARAVLAKTAEADVSASVTGHLGPNAPAELDGIAFVGVARRAKSRLKVVGTWRFQLQQTTRYRRQREARNWYCIALRTTCFDIRQPNAAILWKIV